MWRCLFHVRASGYDVCVRALVSVFVYLAHGGVIYFAKSYVFIDPYLSYWHLIA